MKNEREKELEVPTKESINSYSNYISQFRYLYNNQTVTVTIGSIPDMDPERNDDKYYHFSPEQISQYNELSNSEYNSLWGGVIYGLNNTGDKQDKVGLI